MYKKLIYPKENGVEVYSVENLYSIEYDFILVAVLNKMIKEKIVSKLMKMEFRISIITVVYNAVNTVEQTINSVINQSYKNIEYIIIDGGSTDGTLNVIEKYRDYISHFISESDDGIYDAMNKGIKRATGDIIGIINSDDWYEKTAVEKVVEYFKKHQVGLIYGNMNVIRGKETTKIIPSTDLEDLWYSMVIPHPTVFVQRKIYEKYGLFDTKYELAADYELLLRLYIKGVKFGYINDVLANFREGGQTTKRNNISVLETIEISEKYLYLCPCQERVIKENASRKNNMNFLQICNNDTLLIEKILKNMFYEAKPEIIIFGTGKWGEKIASIIKKTDIKINFFVDNNEQKWNTKFLDKDILNPKELIEIKGCVIVAVKNDVNQIVNQIKSMNNNNLKWITLDELVIYTVGYFKEIKL